MTSTDNGQTTTPQRTDETDNNLIAAGAILAALSGQQVEVVLAADGYPTNQLDIRFAFMKSPYRITIERIAEDPS